MKITLGLVGPIASGKGTIARFLQSKGFKAFSLSDVVRDEARSRGLEINRQNLQDVGNDLRSKFGGAVLVERIIEKARKFDFVVIDGVRNPQEIAAIKEDLNGRIVHVSAYKNRRLERYLDRAETRGEGSASVSKFKKSDARDLGAGEDKNGQQVAECIALSDFKLINNSTIEQFYDDCQSMLDDFFACAPEGIESHSMSIAMPIAREDALGYNLK